MSDKKRRFSDLPTPRFERGPRPTAPGRVRPATFSGSGGFFSCRYSYRSISTDGEKIYVTSREQRFHDGKLETEEFEGTAGPDVFGGAVARMQQQVQEMMARQMELFFQPFSRFLPPSDPDEKKRS